MGTGLRKKVKRFRFKQRSVLPGFGLTMGITVTYLSLIVLIPLVGLILTASHLSFDDYRKIMSNPLVVKSFWFTFWISFVAALVNAFFGFVVAWVLVRYKFWGRRILDAMVDLPFALPTSVSGIALAQIYSRNGWIGRFLPENVQILGTQFGVLLALIFISVPFVVRAVQPSLQELDKELEEVSASLGASRFRTFWSVIFPTILPALLTGFAMAFARALGEYGSVFFIGLMIPGKTQLVSDLIFSKLSEENGPINVSAVAVSMLLLSFCTLLTINLIQLWSNRKVSNEIK